MFALRARLLVVTLWVGSLWTVGYLVAPTLFMTLHDRTLAGTIAGSLFHVEAWLSLVCGLALVVLIKSTSNESQHRTVLRVIAGMLVCTLIGYFGFQPFMAALRESAGAAGVMASDAKMQFGILHGAASVLYLIESLLGVVLILKLR